MKMFSIEFYQKLLYLQVSQAARLSPSESSTPTVVSNLFANSQTIFRFRIFFKNNKPTQSATIVPILWIYRTEDELQSCILFWRDSKGACTVISRSFARSADIVAWPVQRRFGHRGKFQKLFNDRGEIISNLGYSTSFPSNPKQQSRNRVH